LTHGKYGFSRCVALCSRLVQAHVEKKKLLHKTKKPIAAMDLRKLSDVVGLGDATSLALDRVLAIGAATSQDLDSVLSGFDGRPPWLRASCSVPEF
jgi:hypothetical protein